MRVNDYFKVQRTKLYLRFKFWKINLYFTSHPLNIRSQGLEKERRRKKRQKIKARLVEERKCCAMCGKLLTFPEASVHHIVHRKADPSREFDDTNLMLLCHGCHARLHELEIIDIRAKEMQTGAPAKG